MHQDVVFLLGSPIPIVGVYSAPEIPSWMGWEANGNKEEVDGGEGRVKDASPHSGAVLRWGRGHSPPSPRLCCPQIQKLTVPRDF